MRRKFLEFQSVKQTTALLNTKDFVVLTDSMQHSDLSDSTQRNNRPKILITVKMNDYSMIPNEFESLSKNVSRKKWRMI